MVFSVWKNYFSFSLKEPNRLSRPIPASTIQNSILIDEFSVTAVGRDKPTNKMVLIQKRSTIIYTIVLFLIMNLLLLRFMQMSTLLLVLLGVGI